MILFGERLNYMNNLPQPVTKNKFTKLKNFKEKDSSVRKTGLKFLPKLIVRKPVEKMVSKFLLKTYN